jgi:hypothetical protein
MGRNQDKSIYTLGDTDQANIFSKEQPEGFILSHLGGGYGNAGMRPERRPRGRNGGRLSAAFQSPFWRNSGKSQGFGDRVPK